VKRCHCPTRFVLKPRMTTQERKTKELPCSMVRAGFFFFLVSFAAAVDLFRTATFAT
jgi:hypothetical protein